MSVVSRSLQAAPINLLLQNVYFLKTRAFAQISSGTLDAANEVGWFGSSVAITAAKMRAEGQFWVVAAGTGLLLSAPWKEAAFQRGGGIMVRLNPGTHKRTAAHARVRAAQRMIRLVTELTREDQCLTAPLLDAAVAGLILGFRPYDGEMREQAARAWHTIKPLLSHHLLSEDETLLPWARSVAGFPRTLLGWMEKQHAEFRTLTNAIGSTSFRRGDDAEVSKAGKALCMLAVKLDDLVCSEELRLLPTLRRFVFARPQPRSAPTEEIAGC